MRILLATPLYPPELGGPATYAKLLEEELPKKGHTVQLLKFRDVRRYPKILRHLVYAFKIFVGALRADVVYVLDPVSTGLPAALASICAFKPLYLKVVGDYAWEQGRQRFGVTDHLDVFVTKANYPFGVQLLKAVQTFVARRARGVIVPSQYLRKIVMQWGIRESRITVVYNAPPKVRHESARPTEPRGPYVVTLGRLVPWKGVAAVIDAVVATPDLSLVVIGDGPERASLEARANERVLFTGALPQEEAHRYLAHADAFVLNTCYEGFSHVLLEACALGVPVATTDAGGNPELITHEKTGLVFAYNDVDAIANAIARLRTDTKLRAHVVLEAAATVNGFSHERMITETVTALSV